MDDEVRLTIVGVDRDTNWFAIVFFRDEKTEIDAI